MAMESVRLFRKLYSVFASAGFVSNIHDASLSMMVELAVTYSNSFLFAQPLQPDFVCKRTTSSSGLLFRIEADSLDCNVQIFPLPSFNWVSWISPFLDATKEAALMLEIIANSIKKGILW